MDFEALPAPPSVLMLGSPLPANRIRHPLPLASAVHCRAEHKLQLSSP